MEIKTTKKVSDQGIGVVIYSTAGAGKSTFLGDACIDAKNGMFVQIGENALADLDRGWASKIPQLSDDNGNSRILGVGNTTEALAKEWVYFKQDLLKSLMMQDHGIDTLALDNFDYAVNYNLDAYVLLEYYDGNASKANSYGGQKLNEMYKELVEVSHAFNYLKKRKNMDIYLSMHSQIVRAKNPLGEDYERYTFDLPARKDYDLRPVLLNNSSFTLFGNCDPKVIKENKKGVGKARGGRESYKLYTTLNPSYDAKNRGDFPETIEFNYSAFKAALNKANTKDTEKEGGK